MTAARPTVRTADGISILYYVERMFEAHSKALSAAKEAADLRIGPVCTTVTELKTKSDQASGRSSVAAIISILALLSSIVLHFVK